MKFSIVELLVTVAVIVFVDGNPIEYYATKYDHLDVEEVLNNRRMVKYYANCLLSKGPCTPQGLELKKILPEALETTCLRCTEKQKAVTYQSIRRLRKEYPKTWTLLQAKWDPDNIYVKRFEDSLKLKLTPDIPENEIILSNRFGDFDDSKSSSTTETITTKPTTTVGSTTKPPTEKTTKRIAPTSETKPQNPRYPGVNMTDQVNKENGKEKTTVSLKPTPTKTTPFNIPKSSTRQPDPISQLVSSFLNVNQPKPSPKVTSTTTPPESPNLLIRLPKISGLIRRVGARNRQRIEANTTLQISLRRPVVDVRLPGLTVNGQIEGFNPVGNIVRGLANAGDRLIETGTNIADTVLTSVRGLFTPTARRNRALRRI